MLRKCLFGFAGAVAILASPAAAKPVDAVEAYNAAMDAFQADNCARVDELTPVILSSPGFANLEPKYQSTTFAMAGFCAIRRNDWKSAYHSFAVATGYADALDIAFTYRFVAASELGEIEDAVAALELAARVRPKALGALTPRDLFKLKRALAGDGGNPQRSRFFAALDKADYQPDQPFRTGSYLWIEYAADLADASDPAGAARVLGRIDDSDVLVRAQVDRRFFALLDADPQRFDVRAMAERQLAADRALMAAHPDLLDGPIVVASDLRRLGRPEEALAALDAVLPRLKQKEAFQDRDEQLNWYWDERYRAFRQLGRIDDAVSALKTGAEAGENGVANVSQVLNLGDLLDWAGRPEAALAAVEAVVRTDAVSPYGRMVLAQDRVCAYAQLGRRAEMQAELAYVRAHEADNWSVAGDAPLCAGDLDAAAAAFVRELSDPDARRDALIELSTFDSSDHETPEDLAFRAHLEEVAARPEVKAAVAKAGRVMRFHLIRNFS